MKISSCLTAVSGDLVVSELEPGIGLDGFVLGSGELVGVGDEGHLEGVLVGAYGRSSFALCCAQQSSTESVMTFGQSCTGFLGRSRNLETIISTGFRSLCSITATRGDKS